MNVFTWLKRRLSSGNKAMRLYRRGMLNAKSHKNESAIVDYTAVVEMADVPAGVLAMALYNRALVYHATAKHDCAINDLRRVLDMPGAAADVKTEARRKLVRIERTYRRSESREADSTSQNYDGMHARSDTKAATGNASGR